MDFSKDYYTILGVPISASSNEIRRAWHRQALLHHPDKNPGDQGAALRFIEITQAWEILGNPEIRQRYDQQRLSRAEDLYDESFPDPWLELTVQSDTLMRFETLKVSWSFITDSRRFTRPPMPGWVLAAGPFLEQNQVIRPGGVLQRQTTLNYLYYPVSEGVLEIGEASVEYNGRRIRSRSVKVEVSDCPCFFAAGSMAGNRPLIITLLREVHPPGRGGGRIQLQRRVLPVPRSTLAAWYHRTGRVLKISMTLIGAIGLLPYGLPLLGGALAGNFAGGIQCFLMYKAMKVKARNSFVSYPAYSEALLQGYEPAEAWSWRSIFPTHLNRLLALLS